MKALGLSTGKMIPASKFGQSSEDSESLELSEQEKEMEQKIQVNEKTRLCIHFGSGNFRHLKDCCLCIGSLGWYLGKS